MGTVILVLLLFSTLFSEIHSQCTVVEITGALHHPLTNGPYEPQENSCNERPMYRHSLGEEFYLYWSADYWVVHVLPCQPQANDLGLIRVSSGATHPQFIPDESQWYEHQLPQHPNHWQLNAELDSDCYGDDPYDEEPAGDASSDLPPGVVAGICLGTLAFVVLVGLGAWGLCGYYSKHKPARQTHNTDERSTNQTHIDHVTPEISPRDPPPAYTDTGYSGVYAISHQHYYDKRTQIERHDKGQLH